LRVRVRGEKEIAETEQRIKVDEIATTPLVLSRLTVSWAGNHLRRRKFWFPSKKAWT
jgi:hypothetical protein